MSVRAMEWVAEVTAGKSTDKAVLVALANFHHQKDGECRASVDTISSFTELNRKTVFAALDRLREGGLIDFDKGARKQRKYVLNFDVFSTKLGTIEKRGCSTNFGTIKDDPKVPNTTESGPSLGPNDDNLKVPNTTSLKYQTGQNLVQDLGHTRDTGITRDIPPIVPQEEDSDLFGNNEPPDDDEEQSPGSLREIANRVIEELNTRADRQFKLIDANRRLVIARLNDGFSEEDCIKVIANRVARWQGTEQEQYLRPKTLFRPSNFEGYLNDTLPPEPDRAPAARRYL